MPDELDEFGIPIKKATQNEVDEFGIPIKKKEDSTLQDTELDSGEESTTTSSDLNELESDRPEPTFATDEQISLIKKSSGLSDEQWDDRQNQMAEISSSQKIEQETFKKDEYSEGERSGLFDVNKKTGDTEVITENNDTKQVDIDGFDNEKMQSLTLKMRESAILSNKELQDIDAEIDRKKRGDFNLWEKIQIGAKKRVSLVADVFGWESEKKRKKISSFDRQAMIASKIEAKQSDFFDSLEDEEKNQLESYIVKRNDKISKQFKEAESINNHLNKFVLPKEIKELQNINAAIKKITDKSKNELTEGDVSDYNALVERHSTKVFELKRIDQQYKINRNTMLNSVDDILTFDREMDLAKRDYGWYRNNISPIAEGFLDIGVNTGVFVADLALNAVINNAGKEAFLMDAKKDVQDFAIWYSESRDRDRNSRKIHKTFSELNGIGDYATYTKNLLVEQAPILATIYATGGAGLGIVSSSSGGQRIGQLLKDRKNGLNDFSDTQISGNAFMYFLGEYIGESITLGILNDYKRIFRSIDKSSVLKRTFRENLIKAIKSTYKGISTANAEAMSEVYTEYFQYSGDRTILDQKRTLNVFESYVNGFIIGEGIHLVGATTNMMVGAYSRSSNRKKVSENTIKILEIESLINEGNFTNEVKALYQEKIQTLINANNAIINESVSEIKNLTPIQVTELTAINSKIKAIHATLQGKSTSETKSRESIEKSLNSELLSLLKQKDAILDIAKSNKFDTLSEEDKQDLKNQASKILIAEKEANGEVEYKISDAEITQKAVELANESKPTKTSETNEKKVQETNTEESTSKKEDSTKTEEEKVLESNSSVEVETNAKKESGIKKVGLTPNDPSSKGTAESYSSENMEVTMIRKRPNGQPANTSKKGDVFEVRVSKLGSDGYMRTNNSMTQVFKTPEEARDYANKFIAKDKPTPSNKAVRLANESETSSNETQAQGDTTREDSGEVDTKNNTPIEVLEAQSVVVNIGPSLSDATSEQKTEYKNALKTITDNGYSISLGKLTKNETQAQGDTPTDKNIRSGTGISNNKGESKEVQPTVKSKTDKSEVEVKEGNNIYIVSNKDRLIVVKNSKGKTPSKSTERKILRKYAKTIDLTEGDKYKPQEGEKPLDTDSSIAKNSNNPSELAEVALRTKQKDFIADNTDSEAIQIIEYITGNVKRGKKTTKGNDGSFISQSDANNITFSIAKTYLKSDGKGLDVLAQELSEELGREITEQDIVEVILKYPNGVNDVKKEVRDTYSNVAKQRFTDITGLPSSNWFLNEALEQAIKKEQLNDKLESDYLNDFTEEELLSLEQEQNDYEKTINQSKENVSAPSDTKKNETKPRIQEKSDRDGAEKEKGKTTKSKKGLIEVFKNIFGLDGKKSEAVAEVYDIVMGNMANRLGITKSEMQSKIKFVKGEKAPDGSLKQEAAIWDSSAKKGLNKIKFKKAPTRDWIKKITEFGGKGTKQELEWIGLEDYLNEWIKENKAKSVPKEVVEQYINDNQIEIVEVTKGKENIFIEDDMIDSLGGIYETVYTVTFSDAATVEVDMSGEYNNDEDVPREEIKEKAFELRANDDLRFTGDLTNDSKYSHYTLKGGENYREVLLTLPKKASLNKDDYFVGEMKYDGDETTYYMAQSPSQYAPRRKTRQEAEKDLERIIKTYSEISADKNAYKSDHWDESNILAHIRLNERTLPNGERVLFVEEIQSDWAQEGKKKGYKNPIKKSEIEVKFFKPNPPKGANPNNYPGYWESYDSRNGEMITRHPGRSTKEQVIKEAFGAFDAFIDGKSLPNMPYKKTDQWVGMAIRRVMQMAAQEGFDRVAWVTGQQSADRYDLSKSIESIKVNPYNTYNKISLEHTSGGFIFNTDKKGIVTSGRYQGKSLDEVLGKELAKKIIETKETTTIKGEGLKVGGEGMKTFYNSILPKVAKKESQRFDKKAKVEVVDFRGKTEIKNSKELGKDAIPRELNRENQQLSIAITPEMRMNLNGAVPLFQQEQGAMLAADGNFIVYALTNPNVSTPLHELAHVYEHYLKDSEKKNILNWTGQKEWNTETSEKFARGFEKYLTSGKAPNSKLKQLFEDFKNWLKEIYNGIKGSEIDIELSPEMTKIYDAMFEGETIFKELKPDTVINTENIKSVISKLQKLDKDLTDYGKGNLSFGLPVAVAQGAVKAMITAVKIGKIGADIINAGAKYITKSDWYKNQTKEFKKEIDKDLADKNNFFNSMASVIDEVKKKAKIDSDKRAIRLKETTKKLREQYKDLADYKKALIDEFYNKLKLKTLNNLSNYFNKSIYKKINNAKTFNAIDKIVQDIDFRIAKQEVKKVQSDLKKIITNPKKYLQSINGRIKAKGVDNNTRKILKRIEAYKNKNIAFLEKFRQEIEGNITDKNFEDSLNEVVAIEAVINLKKADELILLAKEDKKDVSGNTNLLIEAANLKRNSIKNLIGIINKGKNNLKEQLKKEHERLKEIATEGTEDTSHKDSGKTESQLQDESHRRRFKFFEKIISKERLEALKNPFKTTAFSFEYILGLIDRKNAHGSGRIYNRFYKGKEGIVQLDSNKARDKREFQAKFKKDLSAILGKKFSNIINDFFYSKSINKIRESGIELVNEKGKLQKITLSYNQAIYVHLVSKMADGREKLENQGWNKKSFDALDTFLGAKYIKVSDYITKLLEDRFGKYNKVYKELLRTDLGKEKNYFPLIYTSLDLKGNVKLEGNDFSITNVMNGNLIARVSNKNRIDITQNALEVLASYLDGMETFYHYGRFTKDLNALINNKDFRNNVMTYDKRAYTDLVKLSKAIIGDNSDFKLDELEKALYSINTGIAAGYIAGRLYTALKQTLSGVSYAEFADMYQVNGKEVFALGLHKLVFYAKYQYNQKNPIKLINNHRFFLKNSVAYSERIKKGNTGDEFLEYLLNNRGKNIFKELFAYITKIGITPNKIVDALTISTAGMVYYKQQYKKYSKVMPEKVAREKAMNDFEISFNLTQQSSSKPNLAPIQIRKGILTSMFGTFKNAQMSYFRRIMANSNNVLRDYVNQKEKFQRLGYSKVKARAKAFNILKTAKTWNEISNILLYTHVMPMAWQYVASGLPGLLTGWDEEDTEEMKRAAYLGALDGVFIVGDIAKYAYNKFKLGKKWRMSEWIALSEMETIFNDVKEASDEDGYFNKEVLWEFTKALLKTKSLNLDTYNNIYEGLISMVKEKEFSMDAVLNILNAPKALKEEGEDKVTIIRTEY